MGTKPGSSVRARGTLNHSVISSAQDHFAFLCLSVCPFVCLSTQLTSYFYVSEDCASCASTLPLSSTPAPKFLSFNWWILTTDTPTSLWSPVATQLKTMVPSPRNLSLCNSLGWRNRIVWRPLQSTIDLWQIQLHAQCGQPQTLWGHDFISRMLLKRWHFTTLLPAFWILHSFCPSSAMFLEP